MVWQHLFWISYRLELFIGLQSAEELELLEELLGIIATDPINIVTDDLHPDVIEILVATQSDFPLPQGALKYLELLLAIV